MCKNGLIYANLIFAKKKDLFLLARTFNDLYSTEKEPKLRLFYAKQRGRYAKELVRRGIIENAKDLRPMHRRGGRYK